MSEAILKIHALIISANGHLRAQAFSPSTVDKYNHLWSKLVKFMAASGLEVYDKEVGQDFLAHLYGQFSYSGLSRNEKSVVRKIQYLTEFQEKGSVQVKCKRPGHHFTGDIGNLMESFIKSRQKSGFSPSTLASNKLYLHVLLVFLEGNGVGMAGSITPADLVAFVESQKDTSVTTKYGMFGVIRNFLKHLHSIYPDTRDLSAIIPKVNYIRQAKLPSVYSKEEIQSLLAVIDRGNPKGKRDYALMLIGARLGLRASDILGLTFANLCWESCQIVLDQKKTGRNLELPLTSEIGDAIIDYLKHGRPVSHQPYVFLCLTPPYGQLTNVTVSTITSHYLTLAGIDTSTRKHGAHILRHSLVANLLDQKTPIHVISGTLGHSSTDSTRHYLRIDTKAMEPCALQVPPVSPTFYDRVTDFFFSVKKNQEKL